MKGRVLVVDDDQALAEMLGIVLRGEGYEPVHCADGEVALETFRTTQPDLVLLDEAARPIGTVPAVTLPGTRIPAFYAYWQSSARPGVLPDVSAIDPLLMPPEILPFLVVYAIESDSGLRMRLIGTAVVENTGADFTGRVIEPFGVMATLHARLKPGADAEGSIGAIKMRLKNTHGIAHATVEVETGPACPDDIEHDMQRRKRNGTIGR